MPSPLRRSRVIAVVFVLAALCAQAAPPVLKALFLGDGGHHQPSVRLRTLGPVMMSRGIHLVYTEDLASLTLENLRRYDALLIYANIDQIAPAPEQALLDYVTQGGGLVALHCASSCFRNSDRYVALVGAQFKSHDTGVVRTRVVAPDHPVMKGYSSFESWDETYTHSRHSAENRIVLEQRENEPWTWVRTEGKGRVFYTAWGHDDRTWSNPGFHDLVERGIRFAAGQKLPGALGDRPKIPGFEYVDQPGIPYYSPGQRTQGEGPWPQIQKPLSPADSLQHLVVPAGFDVQLVASEPDIHKPIAMAWDERGRLWIAESLDYPNKLLDPGQPGRDRLVICDDTNHDGRMDTFTVFADGLNIPTGFTFANGGVILLQMPHTLFLKDSDGDDRADLREILFTGWGRSDTHAGPNNLAYGFDNWIWGMLGYSGFTGSVSGEALSFRQGFYRFRPDGSKFEFVRATNNNTWGIGFTEEGHVFASTANNNPSVFMPIPNRYYPPAGLEAKTLGTIAPTSRFVPLTSRVRQVDVHWGYTAAAGHAFYTARAYPKDYWNRVAFVTEPSGHLVGQFTLDPTGANFRATNPTNLIVSDDEWFAPIMAEVGPDGAVWIIDWYNYIIQHNPTPKGFIRGSGNAYENDLRDQRFGRIYRIVWKGDRPDVSTAPAFTLKGATPTQLVAALGNENLLWRRHAQRLLVERGRQDVVPALLDLIINPRVDELGLNVGAIHALWTLHGLHAIDALPDALLVATHALNHPSAGVRLTAAKTLPRTPATTAALLKAGLLNDSDSQVRLAALLALAESPAPAKSAVGQALHDLLDQPGQTLDRWTVDGAKLAATTHAKGFLVTAKPAQITSARAIAAQKTLPLIILETFERVRSDNVANWHLKKISGDADLSLVQPGYESDWCLQLSASGSGADVSAVRNFKVKSKTRYELSARVKTRDIVPTGAGLGALIAVPQALGPRPGISIATKGTSDWSQIRMLFDSGPLEEVSVAAVLGSGGLASGMAWFDDFTLVDLGPTDETVADPYLVVLAHVLSQTSGRPGSGDAAPSDVGVNIIQLGVIPDVMKYDKPELTVKAGEKVKIVFTNTDHMQHNALILRPGKTDVVGALADAMLTDPSALSRGFVPASPDVLFSLPLVNPGEVADLSFTAPITAGRYPIVCTFPGHWRIMQSVLVVE